MDKTDSELLETIADLHGIPEGSFNIRKNGKLLARNSTADIEIVPKKDKDGIDIIVKAGVKNKSVHIPVLLTVGDFQDTVYNDFFIGENADVTIIAGCGIHNETCGNAEHNGLHTFYLAKNAKVKYVEKHFASGDGTGKKVFDPITKIYLKENACFVMEATQLGGVTYTNRKTYATLGKKSQLIVKEKILTDHEEQALTDFKVTLKGKGSRADIVSRSVAKGRSVQKFASDLIGKNECFGHVECDGILLDGARIVSTPKIDAVSPEASLVHEAAVGKIAGEQLLKLMSLGLTEQEAEDAVIKGFLN
ncbi:MAG TPA: SufD family Fe-S cluster assembly protein [Candidatus Borkfalkia excrementavium]|uniref:SufD family Fe-S cluster assembly protein n=1 Tax=Candidatus Borkfalkia excrementavium TaxID=2838505 RepID=A0A9D1Z8A9_9FIRM|nr:SufD family Fe-S cluster assembly protein [Candidatus Borkfalkia excrementavium]